MLVDNDAHKAADGEEGNMVVVPTWDGSRSAESEHDGVLAALVKALLDPAVGLVSKNDGARPPALVDVRPNTAAVTARIASDAPALALAERAAALEAAQRAAGAADAAAAAAAAALPQPPQPSASAKRAAKRAAKEAAATAATALSEAVLVLSSDDSGDEEEDDSGDSNGDSEEDEPLASDLPPEPVLPGTLAAWKTAVLATVAELTAAGAVDLPTVMAYCRHRAPSGELKALLNRKALRTALNSAVKQSKRSAGGGKMSKGSPASSAAAASSPLPPLVLGTKPNGTRCISGKIISKCFAVNPDAVITPASFDEALAALSKVAGGKQTTSGNSGGGKGSSNNCGGAAVAEAIKAVAVASVADLTVRGLACGKNRFFQPNAAHLAQRKREKTSVMRRNARKLSSTPKNRKPQNSSITALRSRSSSATLRKRRASPGIVSMATRGS